MPEEGTKPNSVFTPWADTHCLHFLVRLAKTSYSLLLDVFRSNSSLKTIIKKCEYGEYYSINQSNNQLINHFIKGNEKEIKMEFNQVDLKWAKLPKQIIKKPDKMNGKRRRNIKM